MPTLLIRLHASAAAARWWCVGYSSAAALALLLVFGCTACSHLPPRPELAVSTALAGAGETPLGRTAAASLPAGAPSGFQLLPVASAAYESRLALASEALRTIDMQTFVFDADDSGGYLLSRLGAAARRGVRVRLLVDDLNTSGSDQVLAAFADQPNVEVRLFNPFVIGRGSLRWRLLDSLNELGRVNHRMHNKLLVADNAIAVFGGRNIGDEYFMRAAKGTSSTSTCLAPARLSANCRRASTAIGTAPTRGRSASWCHGRRRRSKMSFYGASRRPNRRLSTRRCRCGCNATPTRRPSWRSVA